MVVINDWTILLVGQVCHWTSWSWFVGSGLRKSRCLQLQEGCSCFDASTSASPLTVSDCHTKLPREVKACPCSIASFLNRCGQTHLGRQLYGLGYPRQPSTGGNFIKRLRVKCSPRRPSQSWPCMTTHNPYWIIKGIDIPLSFRFPWLFDHSGFCRVKFHFFDTNFCFKSLI